MNVVRRLLLISVGLGAAVMLLYPPYYMRFPNGVVDNLGYHFLFDPPSRSGITASVYAPTLLVQLLGLVIIAGSAWLLVRTFPSRSKDSSASGAPLKKPSQEGRPIAIDAVDALNDLVGDLVAGTRVLADYQQDFHSGRITEEQMSAVQKMCVSHIVLASAKLLEFWERYHRLVPVENRDDLKSLNSQLRSKGAKDFRNTVAGHIWDRKQQRPLRHSEVMQMLEVLTGGNLREFLRWVNDPTGNTYPETVLSVIETVRDSIVAKYQIRVEEVISR